MEGTNRQMKNYAYKRNGVPVFTSHGVYGIRYVPEPIYEYPKDHRCHGCPYTLKTNVPSCVFPKRTDGGCFRYPAEKPEPSDPSQRVFDFIKVLEAVKNRKL